LIDSSAVTAAILVGERDAEFFLDRNEKSHHVERIEAEPRPFLEMAKELNVVSDLGWPQTQRGVDRPKKKFLEVGPTIDGTHQVFP
jgi:uncharacterized protein with PIN domain